eukprot:7541784-Ditylum_brightwellii.AAC.1
MNKLLSFEGRNEASQNCAHIYHWEIAQYPDIGIIKEVATKTTACKAFENSLWSTATFLLAIAATHYVEEKCPHKHPAKNRHGTDGAKKLVRLVKDAIGKHEGRRIHELSLRISNQFNQVYHNTAAVLPNIGQIVIKSINSTAEYNPNRQQY